MQFVVKSTNCSFVPKNGVFFLHKRSFAIVRISDAMINEIQLTRVR